MVPFTHLVEFNIMSSARSLLMPGLNTFGVILGNEQKRFCSLLFDEEAEGFLAAIKRI